MHDFAEPEREIGDQVCGGDDFPDWKIRDGRQGVGMKLERRRPSPCSLEDDVREIEPNQFADTRRAVDMGNDLQQKPRLVERLCRRVVPWSEPLLFGVNRFRAHAAANLRRSSRARLRRARA